MSKIRGIFLSKIVDPAGNTVTLSYDGNMRITTITDALSQAPTHSHSGHISGFLDLD